jgi:hypothetical protein
MGFAAARRGCRKQMCLASRSSELQATPTFIAERGRRDAVRLRAERLPLAAVEGHARRQRSAAITAMDWQGLGTVIARKSRSVFTAARRCHDEISIPLPAFGTAQQPRPIDIVIAEPCCAAWVAMSGSSACPKVSSFPNADEFASRGSPGRGDQGAALPLRYLRADEFGELTQGLHHVTIELLLPGCAGHVRASP